MWKNRLARLWEHRPRARRWYWIGGSALVLLLIAYAAAFLVDEPIRRRVEGQMNARLKGYSVRLGQADFHPLTFAIDFRDLVVRQDANPEPPVMRIPRLGASVEWHSLVRAKVAGNVVIDSPQLYVNLNHLQQEVKEKVPPSERGWQDALQEAYPLTINTIDITDGSVTYIERGPSEPLRLHDLDIRLENIKNVRAPDTDYPSVVTVRGIIFDHGRLAVDGRANFLAKPHLAVAGQVAIDGMEIDYLKPIARKYNVALSQGRLDLAGRFEYAADDTTTAVLETVTLRGVQIEYAHVPAAAPAERAAGRTTLAATKKAADHPTSTFRVDKLDILDTTVAYVNKGAKPPYRVTFSNAQLHVENLTNQGSEGVARATLRGKFMGSGETDGTASFRVTPQGPDFTMKLAIDHTALENMNDILKAHGGFDVVGGSFSLYAELTGKRGAISGYVKPLFKDVVAYDPQQDRDKSFVQKMKERVVGAVSKVLENRPRSEVATRVDVSGRLDNPNTSTVEVVVKLIQNAFFKAILPGFEQSIGRKPSPPPTAAESGATRRGPPS